MLVIHVRTVIEPEIMRRACTALRRRILAAATIAYLGPLLVLSILSFPLRIFVSLGEYKVTVHGGIVELWRGAHPTPSFSVRRNKWPDVKYLICQYGFLPKTDSPMGIYTVTIPLWLLLLPGLCVMGAFALWPATRPWPGSGLRACRHCGYDLTGNITGRCPECGTSNGT